MDQASANKIAKAIVQLDASELAKVVNEDITQHMFEKFSIRVKNNDTKTHKVALLSAFYDTDDFLSSRTTQQLNQSSESEINKNGFAVSAVSFDGKKTISNPDTTGATIDFESDNPSVTISAFKRYIRTNPHFIKSMLIVATDQNAFSASLELTKASPLGNGKTVRIDLNQFFSPKQFQSDRIIVNFANCPLEICDDLVMAINIPAGAAMEFNFRF